MNIFDDVILPFPVHPIESRLAKDIPLAQTNTIFLKIPSLHGLTLILELNEPSLTRLKKYGRHPRRPVRQATFDLTSQNIDNLLAMYIH